MKGLTLRVCAVLVLALMFTDGASAQGTDATRVLSLINQARVSAGLPPLALNLQLTAAAQAHADDMARNGVSIGHDGSDGTTPATRILNAGYRPYSWGPFVGENWAAYRTVDESMNAWMSDQPHRGNIIRPEYREIGIGVAQSPSGVPILVTDFGAQPNVLPVFLSGTGPSVVLTLTNEDAAPDGDGPNAMGRAVSVEISTDAGFSQARVQPFAVSIQYLSPDGKSISAVYVRFHDASGRTAVSTAVSSSSVSSPASAPVSTPTAVPTRKLAPTRRPAPTRTPAPPPPSATVDPSAQPANLPIENTGLAEDASATPTASQPVIVRRPPLTPAFMGPVSGAAAEEPSVPALAIWLFGASGVVLALAAVTALRMKKR